MTRALPYSALLHLTIRRYNRLLGVLSIMILACHIVVGAEPQPFRPLVFIPGILGTDLLDSQNRIVWGDSGSFLRFADLEITENGPVRQLHPGGLVKQINMLGPFWVVHQYDGLLKTLAANGFRSGDNLFIFTYDWRYSNIENAKGLRAFIEGQPKLRRSDFDILAHSMGGIIAKVYIQTPGQTGHVTRLINLGVPALGSMNAIADMTEGWGGFENTMAGGIPALRRVLFSFPSIYELFPRYRNCCRFEQDHAPFDPTDPELWIRNDWLPPEHRTVARLRMFREALNSAKTLKTILAARLPSGIEEISFVGDRSATNYYWYVNRSTPTWKKWRFSKAQGDGTVPVWSAANSFDLTGSLPAFVDHATIFEDTWVKDKLRWLLNKNTGPPEVRGPGGFLATTTSDKTVGIALVETEVAPACVAAGQPFTLMISIQAADSVIRGDLAPDVSVSRQYGARSKVKLTETTSKKDLAIRTLRFSANIGTSAPGIYTVQVQVPGLGTYARDVLAKADQNGER